MFGRTFVYVGSVLGFVWIDDLKIYFGGVDRMITYTYDRPVRLKDKSVDLSDRWFLFLRSVDSSVQFPVVPFMAVCAGDDYGSESEFCRLSGEISCWPVYGLDDVVPQLVFLNATNLLRYVSRSVEQGILGTVTKREFLNLDFVPSVRDIVHLTSRVNYPNSLYRVDRSCIVMGFGLLWQCDARFSWGVIKKFFGAYRASLLLEDSS